MRALLREPLVHFLVGGAALFLLYGQVAGPGPEPQDRIVVSPDRVAMLTHAFQRTWMRPPTPAELEGLVDDYVTEEVLYREAVALGLDRDDLVVRRRMRQKLEFLNDGLTETEPDEATLRAYLEKNPDRFQIPSRVTFRQVFVEVESKDSPEVRAQAALEKLRAGEDPDDLGDSTQLPPGRKQASPADVSATFGTRFAEALAEVPEGSWSGPLASGFGLHLVHVANREPARQPPLEEVRDAVAREWSAEQRVEARERFYEALRRRYQVEIQRPEATDQTEVATRP